jgi:hypothetical protein
MLHYSSLGSNLDDSCYTGRLVCVAVLIHVPILVAFLFVVVYVMIQTITDHFK